VVVLLFGQVPPRKEGEDLGSSGASPLLKGGIMKRKEQPSSPSRKSPRQSRAVGKLGRRQRDEEEDEEGNGEEEILQSGPPSSEPSSNGKKRRVQQQVEDRDDADAESSEDGFHHNGEELDDDEGSYDSSLEVRLKPYETSSRCFRGISSTPFK